MNVTMIGSSYQPQVAAVKKVLPCEGFDFKTCIRCPFWKHGKCQNGKDMERKDK